MPTSDDLDDDPRPAAVAQLRQLGLSAYAARTFVALVGLGTGTARDVSRVSEVPRTRVYDAVDELRDRGFVEVLQASPKEFRAVSAETAVRAIEHELQRRTATLRTALDELEPVRPRSEQRGVWTVSGQMPVTDRVLSWFDDADDEIVYMTVDGLLTDEVIAGLRAAADRGVSVKLGGVSGDVRKRIQESIPEATVFESLWVWSDTSAARLAMVDRRRTLVSVLADDSRATDGRAETAIWGSGDDNSLVVVLRAIFAWRLDDGPV